METTEKEVKQWGHISNNKYSPLYLKVKGLKSRLFTDLSDLLERVHL